jgi:hypothetical protein
MDVCTHTVTVCDALPRSSWHGDNLPGLPLPAGPSRLPGWVTRRLYPGPARAQGPFDPGSNGLGSFDQGSKGPL